MQKNRLPRLLLVVSLLIALGAGMFVPRLERVEAKPVYSGTMEVIFNEIAWAGTQANVNAEWIELYNPGAVDINLNGWTLRAIDGTPNIILTGIIPANGYYLLERTADTTVNDIPADQIYTGALGNAPAENLELRDESNNLIDTANEGSTVWLAGNTTGFYSMERKTGDPDGPSSWVSNDGIIRNGLDASGNPINGTPKQPNSSIIPTPTPTITNTPTETGTPTNTPTVTQTRTSTPSSTATPVTGPLSVLINEVAWSGTSSTRTNDEWIELHNTLSSSLNLDGWKITMDRGDGEIDFIIFNGDDEIPAGGFFLLGRALNIFNNVIVDKAFSTALPNDGVVILRLYNAQGTFIDSANLGRQSGWYAGTAATTYASMERRGKILDGANAWFTFGGTPFARNRDNALVRGSPKQANWAVNVTPTATPFRTPTRTPTPSRVPTLVVIPRLVINEILARPGFDWNQDGKVDVFDEFIEIKNLGPVTEDLSGWQLDAVNAESAFALPSVSLRPGERVVFYGSQTNLLLSDGGETVRLINPGRTIIDAYTYSFAGVPDRSFCRMPDREFFGSWFEDCIPTPNLVNTREGTVPSMPGGGYESLVCELPDTIPSDFLTAECRSYGTNIWNPYYWDRYGWLGWRMLQSNTSKWASYFE